MNRPSLAGLLSATLLVVLFAAACSKGYTGVGRGGTAPDATTEKEGGDQSLFRPMFGGVPATPEQAKADAIFLEILKARGTGPEEGAREFVELGFKEFFEGNYDKAMHSFNIAWLQDKTNGDIYHGFALVVLDRDRNLELAAEMFERALQAPKLTSSAHADYGRYFLLHRKDPASAVPHLKVAVQREPDNWYAVSNLALAAYQVEENAEACELARKAVDHPGALRASLEFTLLRTITQGFPCR